MNQLIERYIIVLNFKSEKPKEITITPVSYENKKENKSAKNEGGLHIKSSVYPKDRRIDRV